MTARDIIAGAVRQIVDWRTRRFMASLPPYAGVNSDGGEWLLRKFDEINGRAFNPFSQSDRKSIEMGLSRAAVAALPVLFGRAP